MPHWHQRSAIDALLRPGVGVVAHTKHLRASGMTWRAAALLTARWKMSVAKRAWRQWRAVHIHV